MANDTLKLDYVTCSQAKLYLGGILIDDCYDVNYTYKETKEPIYGYNDKHFATVLAGNVIIYGSLTINYRHDSYLHAIINKVRGDQDIFTQADRIQKQLDNLYGSDPNAYINLLKQYKAEQQKTKELKSLLVSAKSNLEIYKNERDATLVKNSAEITAEEDRLIAANKKSSDFINNMEDINFESDLLVFENLQKTRDDLIAEQRTIIENLELKQAQPEFSIDIAREDSILDVSLPQKIKDAYDRIETTQTAYNSMMETYLDEHPNIKDHKNNQLDVQNSQSSVAGKYAQENDWENIADNQELEVIQAERALEKNTAELVKLRDQMVARYNEENKDLQDIESAMNGAIGEDIEPSERAEDVQELNLFLEYNGAVHKVLKRVTFTGHSHMVGQGGQSIKEQYYFVASHII